MSMSKLTDLLLADAYVGGGSGGGGGGEKWTETLLWENPNPTATTFVAQTIPASALSESVTEFEILLVTYAADGFNLDKIYKSVIFIYEVTSSYYYFGSYVHRFRNLGITNNGDIRIDTSKTVGSTNTSSSYILPLAIYGIKKG